MTSTNSTTREREALVSALATALDDLGDARERLMDEDNDGADFRAVNAAEAAVASARSALAAFDAQHPDVLAAKREAAEPARLDFLRRLRADEGLTVEQAAELDALQAKHGKHYLDMTPEEQAEQRARNAAAAADREAAFFAEWTPEVTASRRAAWNAGLESRGIMRGKASPKGLRIDLVQAELEREFGFSFSALKRAVAKYA